MSAPVSFQPWLTAELMTRPSRSLSELRSLEGEGAGWLAWHERRPEEKGRGVVTARRPDGRLVDLTPLESDVGSAIHYGGGAWTFRRGRKGVETFFTTRRTGGLWRSLEGGRAECLVAAEPHVRFADLALGSETLFCVCERDETDAKGKILRTVMEIVALSVPEGGEKSIPSQKAGTLRVVARGADFMMSPRPSPDGRFLAWVEWDFPFMPWTATRLCVADFAAGQGKIPARTVLLDGKPQEGFQDSTDNTSWKPLQDTGTSTIEPFWGDRETLYALTDQCQPDQAEAQRHWTPTAFRRSGMQGSETQPERLKAETGWERLLLPPAPAEIGLPAWVFGQRTCLALPDGRLLARGLKDGVAQLLCFTPDAASGLQSNTHHAASGTRTGGQWQQVCVPARPAMTPGSPAQGISGQPESVPVPLGTGDLFAWIDCPDDQPPAVVTGSLLRGLSSCEEGHGNRTETVETVRQAWALPQNLTPADLARPRLLTIPVTEDPGPLRAFYTPPARGPYCTGLPGGKQAAENGQPPPMVVIVHGGPTGQARAELSFKVQWWTTRGYAVLEVNYRGSTGFGRPYREALAGHWGLLDVQDCLTAAQYAIDHGLADPQRCVIRGSSAGGLTVLAALAAGPLFRAGTSLYGVTDLRALAEDTHRFEARYLDGLVAPWPVGEATYLARSPLSWPERISQPVLFLHGGCDKVVPLAQAEALHARLPDSLLHLYPDEGHGFRAPETLADALQRELAFYESVFQQADGVG
ncbi:S9 family peptidase [Oecophyllibacter saccharovorans]|uniref:S9 family peptidase n=1 Tax=Oecophyllibacter saccharovorans TaxID=2558360 RepID=UPI001171715E|nr:prolyl oligopeptidase family serine peptidase [Oecophyllibacter saccharovorans]TPW33697.1 S9 family peptidase [Oecophyllibacter saccharovorans]